jgi:asparagine synthase (glutamine-hydrolysing)
MLDAEQHRGPDDRGVVVDAPVHIGQVRLSIIDLEGGQQPIANEDETLWIVCNGEIYNYRELSESLQRRGHRFRTSSDSEVILHLYEEYGERCVEHLRGMFAFAIWDSRTRSLFAARDHLGQKPFYYAAVNGEFYFASEIKAVLAAKPELRELDPAALDQYLALRFVAAPRSMFSKVRKLPPGHRLTFAIDGGMHIDRYWQLGYEPKSGLSADEALESLEEQLLESLRLHMVSDVPVGAFLSGGLDSGLIVAMLSQHVVSEPLQTFTLGLVHEQFDEAPAARSVADRYGTLHREATVNPSIIDRLPDLVWHLDEPSDPLSLCAWLVAELASNHVKVVLGGDGGDELFGGYDRYYGYQYADRYALIPRFIRNSLLGPVIAGRSGGNWYKSRMHQLKWLHRLAQQTGGRRYASALNYFYFEPDARTSLYGERMNGSVAKYDAEGFVSGSFDHASAREPVDRMLASDIEARLPDHPVMITDRMTMAHGLEARSPFMDHKLAEFCARLPVNLKVKGRSLRILQTRLAERYLPNDVVRHPKQGFASAMPYLLRDEYPVLFHTLLEDSQLVREGYLRDNVVRDLLQAHLAGREDHGNRLWLLANSEIWYRMAIQGHSREALREQMTAKGKRAA